MTSSGRVQSLLAWCHRQLTGYPGVSHVTDFSLDSWRDGLAFCALIHRYRPELIDFHSLVKEKGYENCDLAFIIAEQELGIPALLTASDMMAGSVDKLSMVTYVSQIFNHFKHAQAGGGPAVHKYEAKDKDKIPSYPRRGSQSPQRRPQSVQDVCSICGERIFFLEKHVDNDQVYHRSCFRKDQIQRLGRKILTMGRNYQPPPKFSGGSHETHSQPTSGASSISPSSSSGPSRASMSPSPPPRPLSRPATSTSPPRSTEVSPKKASSVHSASSPSKNHSPLHASGASSQKTSPAHSAISSPKGTSPAYSSPQRNEVTLDGTISPKANGEISKELSSDPSPSKPPPPSISRDTSPKKESEGSPLRRDEFASKPLHVSSSATRITSSLQNNDLLRPTSSTSLTESPGLRRSKRHAPPPPPGAASSGKPSTNRRSTQGVQKQEEEFYYPEELNPFASEEEIIKAKQHLKAEVATTRSHTFHDPRSPSQKGDEEPFVYRGKNPFDEFEYEDSPAAMRKDHQLGGSHSRISHIGLKKRHAPAPPQKTKSSENILGTLQPDNVELSSTDTTNESGRSGSLSQIQSPSAHEDAAVASASVEESTERTHNTSLTQEISESQSENLKEPPHNNADVTSTAPEKPHEEKEEQSAAVGADGSADHNENAHNELPNADISSTAPEEPHEEKEEHPAAVGADGSADHNELHDADISSTAPEEPHQKTEEHPAAVGADGSADHNENAHNELPDADISSTAPEEPHEKTEEHPAPDNGSLNHSEEETALRSKKPAPPRPLPPKRLVRAYGGADFVPFEKIKEELETLNTEQTRVEMRGREIQEALWKADESTGEFEELLVEWLHLVAEKELLYKTESDLVVRLEEQELEEKHTELEHELRTLMCKQESQKTAEERAREEQLISMLVETVEKRAHLVEIEDEGQASLEEEHRKKDFLEKKFRKMLCIGDKMRKKASTMNTEKTKKEKSHHKRFTLKKEKKEKK